jgi:hypothetical protein
VEASVQRNQVGHPIGKVVKERPFRYAGRRDKGVDAEALEAQLLGEHQARLDQIRPGQLCGREALVRHLHVR